MITVVVQVLPISARVLAIAQALTYQFVSVPAANLSTNSKFKFNFLYLKFNIYGMNDKAKTSSFIFQLRGIKNISQTT
jgi:hypothetical protein